MKQATLTKTTMMRFTPKQWDTYNQVAKLQGYSGVAAMLRDLADDYCRYIMDCQGSTVVPE